MNLQLTMKVLPIVALLVAVAAAQSGDEDPTVTEIPEDGGWPGHPPFQPNGRPSEKPGRGPPGGFNWGNGGHRPSFGLRPTPPEFRPVTLSHRRPGGARPGHHFHQNHTVFSPVFKIDNVAFQPQNSTVVQLKEGDNIFFLMKGIRPPCKQYLKLTYNSTVPKQVSMEFGELEPPTRVFVPVFKVENVTFENSTSVQLMEGDNLFFKLKGRRPHHFKVPFHKPPRGPPFGGQYVKLTYKSTEPNQVSVEYGIVKSIFSMLTGGDED